MSSRGGLYVARTDKPHAFLGLPIIGRHTGYVGMSNSFKIREGQHRNGSVTYGTTPASWSDLRPKFYRIPLPRFILHGKHRRKVTKALETLLIYALCPRYNVAQQPPWNVRKTSRASAARERARRDMLGVGYRITRWALRMLVWVVIIGVAIGVYQHA